MTNLALDNISDLVTDYARSVISGYTPAGPHVRGSCRRHLDDLENAAERGFFFDSEHANYVINFFRQVLKLNGGDFEGVAYDPLPWQCFVIGSLFGWIDENGYRRFRVAFVETGKGSGKSPLAAGIGMFGLIADNESRAEVYAAAAKKDQAMILFRDAIAMVDLSPELNKRITKSGTGQNVWNLAYLEKGSFFRPISADQGQSGPRPHISLLDEIHEHKNRNVVNMLRAGTKGRKQALMFMITNSGHDKTSVCWDYHDYGVKVAARQIEDDAFFSYICALDEGDDPMNDESCWGKANPSLGVTIPLKYLRELVTQARGMPSAESEVRRLNFCQWVGAENPWISADMWFNAQEDIDIELLRDRRCYGGLDLSSSQDLTSLVLEFEPTDEDPMYRYLHYFWLPEEGLKAKSELDNVDYISWVKDGYLEATPGKAISRRHVCMRILQITSMFDLQMIGYDEWRIDDLIQVLVDDGEELPLLPFRQGFKTMSPALDEFELVLINDLAKHQINPVMTWCAANAVIDTDPAGNRKVTKAKATGRVDGVVAAIMAAGTRLRMAKEPTVNIDDFINDPLIL